jgi:hypothetical protein
MKTNNKETATTQQSDEEQLVTIMSCGFARELGIQLPLELQEKDDYYSWNITALRAQQWVTELFTTWGGALKAPVLRCCCVGHALSQRS